MDAFMHLLIKGFVIGFSLAAPVGPIGIWCIRLTLMNGVAVGFAAGFGVATADACFGIVAAFGLTSISSFLLAQKTLLSIFGGIFLGYLGIKTFLTQPPSTKTAAHKSKGLVGAYASTFALTITHPVTILSFMAIFASIDIINTNNNYGDACAFVIGIFTGSALWWLLLSSMIGLLQHKVTPTALRWINILSGIIILTFAVGILCQS